MGFARPEGTVYAIQRQTVFKYHTNKTGDNSSIKPPMNQHIDMFSTQAGSLPNPRGPWTRARQTPSAVQNSKQLEVPIPSSPFSLFPFPLSVQSFVRVCFLFLVTWSGGSRIPLQVSETLLSPRCVHASTARPSSLNIPISQGLPSSCCRCTYERP